MSPPALTLGSSNYEDEIGSRIVNEPTLTMFRNGVRVLETLVLYRKRASTKGAYLNMVVQGAFDKAV